MSVRQPFDNDFTEAPIIDVYIDDQRYKTFTQEVQALSDPSSKIKWIVGMFYMHDKSGFGGPQGLGLYGAGIGLPPPLGVGIHNKITTDSYAGFGEATLPLSEFTNLTVGARYTKDKRELSGYTDVLTDPDTRTVIATTPISPEPDKSFSKTTFRAILDHRFVEGLMGYASFSRGFKAGNFNTVSSTDPPFKPEELDAYQIGVKSDLLKGRLRLNIDAYRYKYKEIQLPVSNGPTISTINAAKATIHGVELAGTVVATNQFTIDFGANWLKAEFDSFPNAPCFLPASVGTAVPCGKANVATDCVPTLPTPTAVQYSCNLADNRLPNTPKFTANLAPTYTLDSSIGRFTGSVGYSYTDSFYWESSNTLKQDSYSLVNAQIRWVDRREAWGVKLFAANLTDKKYVVFGQTGLNGYSLAAGSPRTYGVEISYTF
jgi:iron complex outermembrane receptor protein